MNREVKIDAVPQRIISLVPSQTELLFDLGLEDRVVGITKFCIYPKNKINKIAKVGGTKQFKLDVIEQLKPDLIIGNMEENYEEGINFLEKKYPVWMSNIFTLLDAQEMIREVGKITGKSTASDTLADNISNNFQKLSNMPFATVAYFIWKGPYMAVGANTFIDDMLQRCGLINVFADRNRYPEISREQLAKAAPEFIFLSSEPFPFSEKHFHEFQLLCPTAKVLIVDGEMFSWYGSRLLYAADYFQKLIKELQH